MSKVTIYSTATCGFCHMLKSYLDSYGIEYTEKRADKDQKLAMELYQKSGQLGVPFTIIEDDDGKQQGVLGFDRPKINAALGIS